MSDVRYADELFPETKAEGKFADELFPTSVDAENARKKLGGGPIQDLLFSNEKFSAARILSHFGHGFKEGWGDKAGLSEKAEKELRERGIINDYSQGQANLAKAGVESLMHAGVMVFQTLSGTMRGVQEVIAKTGEDVGQKHLGRDLAAMVDAFPHARPLTGTTGIPTPRSLQVAAPGETMLLRARAAKVIGHGEEGWRGGVTTEIPKAPYDVDAAARTAEGFAPEQVMQTGKPIEEQRAFIHGDVREKLIAAGRPEMEADAAAAIDAAYWETRAARFGGAKGSAEEMYKAEAPEIVAGKSRAEADAKTFAQSGGLPMDEAARVARSKVLGFGDREWFHATTQDFAEFDLGRSGSSTTVGGKERAVFLTSRAQGADTFLPQGYVWKYSDGWTRERYAKLEGEFYDQHSILREPFSQKRDVAEQVAARKAAQERIAALETELKGARRAELEYGEGSNIMPLRVRGEDKFVVWDMGGGGYKPEFVERELKKARKAGKKAVLFANMRDMGYSANNALVQHVLAVIDPSIIRSKFAEFDPERVGSPNILYQLERQVPTFYSAVEQAVTNAKTAKASPDQWLGTLKNTPGVKPEELEWLGLDPWLKSQGKSVSKEDVAGYIRANSIELKEVTKGADPNLESAARVLAESHGNTWGSLSPTDRSRYLHRAAGRRLTEDIPGEPKFSQYTLPGGENYREMLLTLPSKDDGKSARMTELERKLQNAGDYDDHEVAAFQREYKRLADETRESGTYKSAHWDEPNILAHVRFNDRVIDGKRTLFLEELQSDWHQAGKKKGYSGQNDIAALKREQTDILAKFDAAEREMPADVFASGGFTKLNWLDKNKPEIAVLEPRLREINSLLVREQSSVPDAPFKTTWPELILKRMIRYAAENGYEKIAWTPGEVQAARYDLSKHVKKVILTPVETVHSGEKVKWKIDAIDHNNKRAIEHYAKTDEEIADVVGKEVAEKLLSTRNSHGAATVEGLDLKVGGEGMLGFYDDILPATANKLVKKYGARVGRGEINTGKDQTPDNARYLFQQNDDGSSWRVRTNDGETVQTGLTREAAQAEMRRLNGGDRIESEKVHTLDLTPQLKEAAIEKGFPLFQGEGTVQRGRIRIREEGRNTITLLKDANASTFIHEKGHDYLARLVKDADDPIAPAQLKEDGATVLKWLGVEKASDIKTSHHEKFARGFETYVMEGKAPSQGLARVFEQFRQWLLRIYTEAARLKAPMNDEIRAVFDRMFALEPEQVKITPERAAALRAEATAEVAPPHMAGAEAAAIRAESDILARQLSPELQDARLAGTREEIGGRPPEGAEYGVRANEAAGPVARGAGTSPEHRADGPIRSAPPVEALTVAEKPAGDVRPHDSFGPHTDAMDKAGNIRLDLLNAPDDVKRVISQIAEESDGFRSVRGPVSDVQVAELAEAMGMDAQYLSTRKMGEAWTAPQIVALRNLLIQSASDVRDLMKKAATGDEAALQAYAEAKTRHMMIQERVSSVTSEAGRALRAFRKNFSAGMEEAASLGEFLKKETGQTLYQLQREAQLGASLETPAQVSKFINDTRKATVSEMIQEAWINALLSGPITHVKNIIGNSVVAVMGTAETAIASGVGKVRALAGNDAERVTLGEAQANLFGLIQGAQDGLRAAKYAFQHEEQYTRAQTLEQGKFQAIPSKRIVMEKYAQGSPEYNKRIDSIANARAHAERLTGEALEKRVEELKKNPPSDMVAEAQEKAIEIGGKQARTPGRLLTAEDEFFKTIAYRQKLNELAFREATKEKLSGDAFNQRIAQLTMYPPEEMMTAASKHADYQTFTNSLGTTGRAIQQFSNSHILAKLVLPFVRTPINILKYAQERTPLGVFSREVRANLSGVNGKIAQDQQIARMVMGTSMAITAMYMASEGIITGGGPSDRNEKAALMLSGWRPYSIKIGEHYYGFGWLDPFSTIMGISGDIADTIKKLGDADDDEMGKIAVNLFASISKNILSKSSLRGASDIMNAATDPDRFGDRYIQNLAGTVVPTAVAQQAKAYDEYQREVRTVLDAIKSRVPGLRTTLLPKRDVWGEPIAAGDALGPDPVSPIVVGKLTKDPATLALLDSESFPAKLQRKIRGVELTDQQYDDYSRIAGRMAKMRVDAIVSNQGFQMLPAEARSEMLKKAINNSREAARSIIMMQNPEIIQKAMDNKLSAVGR